MSDFERVVRGKIVDSESTCDDGWLGIAAGKIAARGTGQPPAAQEFLDVRGHWVIPGVVDGQVHAASQANQEGLGWASRAAAAGGVTVMVDMPYDDPEPIACAAQLRRKAAEAERDCHVDVGLFATLNETHGIDALPGLIEAGACAFKFSTFEAAAGRFPRIDEDLLEEIFRRLAPSGLVCGVHNQMQEMTRKRMRRLIDAGDTGWDAYLRALPPSVEDLATALIYELGAQTGARAHPVHVSTSRGFELCRIYQADGHKASIETCIQYLMLNHEEHTRALGAKTKHFPPIRPKAEVEKLWTHIASEQCTFVSSDHVSWGLERKGNPNVFLNASGGPGLETLLPAFWTGCAARGLSPSLLVRLLCRNPARHFLLDDRKGDLRVGQDADFVVLAPQRYRYDPGTSLGAVRWSSFEGMEFSAKVLSTYCRGERVFEDGRIHNQAGYGRFLKPHNHPEVRLK